MFGSLMNAAGIIVGGLLGLLFSKGIPERVKEAMLRVQGLGVFLIGTAGFLAEGLRVDPATGALSTQNGLLLIISLAVGCGVGEALRIEDRLNAWGKAFEIRFKADGFSQGFVAASILFVVGAMSVIGPITEGLTGNADVLLVKTVIDATMAAVLASVLGFGVPFSAVPVLAYEGTLAMLATWLSPYITPELLSSFCLVGYALVASIGYNFLADGKIRTANLLPSLLVPFIWHWAI